MFHIVLHSLYNKTKIQTILFILKRKHKAQITKAKQRTKQKSTNALSRLCFDGCVLFGLCVFRTLCFLDIRSPSFRSDSKIVCN